ncbi:aminotransferase class I/II-fold pyridoxal phosphate-dependent enzyme, partial [bacterium]|nr:aminotransferase class I/II-fold pyridoxal phosphate-dependent enzyme [bacterium]
SAVRVCRPDLILLNNPHNPSGALCSRNDLIRFASEMLQFRSCLIVDEAFMDYCPEESLVPHIVKLSNVIVIRSLTKFYAIPGLRIGYVVCNAELAQKIRQQIEAWPVSSIALQTGKAAVSDQMYDEMVRTKNEIARTQFAEELNQIPGVTVFPSSANFLLIKFRIATGSDLEKYLESYRILIRRCSTFHGLNDSFIRVAVRSPEDNVRLGELLAIWIKKLHAR